MKTSVIEGLDHIQLAMPKGEEPQARAFYGELLGLLELPKPPELVARGGLWFALGSQALHLGVETPFSPARKAHPALRVSDLETCRQQLEKAGVPTLPDTSVASVHRFYAADPFGNRLEFMQAGDRFLLGGAVD